MWRSRPDKVDVMKEILGKKIGMTRIFEDTGEMIPVTVIEAGPCSVVAKTIREARHRVPGRVRGSSCQVDQQAARRHFRQGQGRNRPVTCGPFAWTSVELEVGADCQGRHFQGRRESRCHRYLPRIGLCRRHEAASFQRWSGDARSVRSSARAGFSRFFILSVTRLQGDAHGGQDG